MDSVTEAAAEDGAPLNSKGGRLLGNAGLRQFIKFCMVGGTSTIVDLAILVLLSKYVGLWWTLAKTISFACGVTNGFIWNNRWTFGHLERTNTRNRYFRFFAVNIVGFTLSLCIMKGVFVAYYQAWLHPNPHLMILLIAQFTAIPIVVFWNFFANKHWTFKT